MGATPPATSSAAIADTRASQFVQQLGVGNLFEIDSGNLALQKSSNEQIKSFAQDVTGDRAKAAAQLSATVRKANDLVAPPAYLDSKHVEMLEALRLLAGPQFDSQYAQDEVEDEDATLVLLQSYLRDGDREQLKQLINQLLPVITHDLQMAKQVAAIESGAK
jgi:putative membrane protein